MEAWEDAAPDSTRYAYRPSLKPHPFMGLSKFDAGRLHQMRSGKSYLCAHPSWDDDGPNNRPRLRRRPQDLRVRHPPLPSERACQDPPPSGGHGAWPRRPRLVFGSPPGRTLPIC